MQKTLMLIKPDATYRNLENEIDDIITKNGFIIVASKRFKFTDELINSFYSDHKNKDFFNSLKEYMTSGEVIAQILEKDNAIEDWRNLMGDTDKEKAKEGTIRKKYAISKTKNSVHGSDSIANAKKEIDLLFPEYSNKCKKGISNE